MKTLSHPLYPHLSVNELGRFRPFINWKDCAVEVKQLLLKHAPPHIEDFKISFHDGGFDWPYPWINIDYSGDLDASKRAKFELLNVRRHWFERTSSELEKLGLSLCDITETGAGVFISEEAETQLRHIHDCSRYEGLLAAERNGPPDPHLADVLAKTDDPRQIKKSAVTAALRQELDLIEARVASWVDQRSEDGEHNNTTVAEQLYEHAHALAEKVQEIRRMAHLTRAGLL
jgi:hypothetical protein